MRVELLVEGHGDQSAVPSLITKFLGDRGFFRVTLYAHLHILEWPIEWISVKIT